jgi:chromosome segregation ATPase
MKAVMHTFDTHKYVKELQATGFDEHQAEVIVKSLLESRDYDASKLATKEQIFVLEKDIKSIEEDIKSIEEDIRSIEEDIKSMKEELKSIRVEMATKDELKSLRDEMKNFVTKDEFYSYVRSETTAVKTDILKWMIPMFLAIMLQLFFK